MTFAEVVARLEGGFERALPGPDAQARLSPAPRRAWPTGPNVPRVRHAAGLLLVFPSAAATGAEPENDVSSEAHVVLTVRAETLRHGGQVSLPGGVVEPGETLEQAALREAYEEVALPPNDVRVLGALTPIDIPVSGFRLHPIVAAAAVKPTLAPADGEVAGILEVAVSRLLHPDTLAWTERERDGVAVTVPAFLVAGHEIWGATAMVLAEFLTMLGWQGPGTR